MTSQPATAPGGREQLCTRIGQGVFVFAELRFQTPTSCQPTSIAVAIDDPIRPVPHTPIFIV